MTQNIETTKLVFNDKYGGFGLIDEIMEKLEQELGERFCFNNHTLTFRTNKRVIELIEEYGIEEASEMYCHLKIIEIPTIMAQYVKISEYDGHENPQIDYNEAYRDLLDSYINGKITKETLIEKYNYYAYLENNYKY